jgi:hypothetical protein
MLNRRGLIGGLLAFTSVPAIVRAESLMPIKMAKPLRGPSVIILTDIDSFFDYHDYKIWSNYSIGCSAQAVARMNAQRLMIM